MITVRTAPIDQRAHTNGSCVNASMLIHCVTQRRTRATSRRLHAIRPSSGFDRASCSSNSASVQRDRRAHSNDRSALDEAMKRLGLDSPKKGQLCWWRRRELNPWTGRSKWLWRLDVCVCPRRCHRNVPSCRENEIESADLPDPRAPTTDARLPASERRERTSVTRTGVRHTRSGARHTWHRQLVGEARSPRSEALRTDVLTLRRENVEN